MRNVIILFSIIFLINQLAIAQSEGFYDSLSTARKLMDEQKMSQAISILRSCEKLYPENVHLIRLYGQALYWSKDLEATRNYLKASIDRNPQLDILKLDYGRILFELNQLNEANIFLYEYLKSEPEDAETHIMLGKIAYWQGKSPEKALWHLYSVHNNDPTNQEALALIEEVRQNTSPYLKISSTKYSDSQPLESIQAAAEIGLYQSAWLQPGIQFQNRSFGEDVYARHFQFSNKTALPKSKTTVLMRMGLFQNSWTTRSTFTAGVEIRQKLLGDFEFAGNIDHLPYLYTLRSLNSNVMQTNYSASIARETGSKFKGKMTYQHQQFEDNNFVQWFSLWTLLPVVNTASFQFDIGYAFLAAWSKENRFVLENPGDPNLSPTGTGNIFPGVFDPYFTPQKQMVHSLLAKMNLKLGSSVSISFNNNIGVYARIDNPELIEGGTGGTGPGTPVFPPSTTLPGGIYRVFAPTLYFPLDLKSTVSWRMSKKILLEGEYNYFKTIWFDSHTVSAGLKINFWNDKRTF